MAETLTATNGIPGTRRDVVEFDGITVVIKRGLLGQKVETIPVSRMSSVGWKKSILGKGHIEFTTAGMDGKVEFNALWARQFEALRYAVEAALAD
jgi:hypothetical protein